MRRPANSKRAEYVLPSVRIPVEWVDLSREALEDVMRNVDEAIDALTDPDKVGRPRLPCPEEHQARALDAAWEIRRLTEAAIHLVETMEYCARPIPPPEERVYPPPPPTVPPGPSSSAAPMGFDLDPEDPNDWGPS
jgi:hypothetical protein